MLGPREEERAFATHSAETHPQDLIIIWPPLRSAPVVQVIGEGGLEGLGAACSEGLRASGACGAEVAMAVSGLGVGPFRMGPRLPARSLTAAAILAGRRGLRRGRASSRAWRR